MKNVKFACFSSRLARWRSGNSFTESASVSTPRLDCVARTVAVKWKMSGTGSNFVTTGSSPGKQNGRSREIERKEGRCFASEVEVRLLVSTIGPRRADTAG